jgi:hypothetical protein
MIQKVWRGRLGRKRFAAKKKLDELAISLRESVEPTNLVVEDVKELAYRILNALKDPSAISLASIQLKSSNSVVSPSVLSNITLPPDEVLHLIRLVMMIIEASAGSVGLVNYTFINTRHYAEYHASTVTWAQASKILLRSERFLRMVRSLAFAPSSQPPLVINVPSEVHSLYEAQGNNPKWNLETFSSIGLGRKLCTELFLWLSNMIQIAEKQDQFISYLTSSFPDWIQKFHELHTNLRHHQYDVEMKTYCIRGM